MQQRTSSDEFFTFEKFLSRFFIFETCSLGIIPKIDSFLSSLWRCCSPTACCYAHLRDGKWTWASDGKDLAKFKPGTLVGHSWITLPTGFYHFHELPNVCQCSGNGQKYFMLSWTQTKISFPEPWWQIPPWLQGAVERQSGGFTSHSVSTPPVLVEV